MIIKKKIVQPMGLIRPMWVGLDLCNRLGLVEFFLPIMIGWVKKSF